MFGEVPLCLYISVTVPLIFQFGCIAKDKLEPHFCLMIILPAKLQHPEASNLIY